MKALTAQRAPHAEPDSGVGVASGLKRTEIGVIPESWKIVRLQDVCREPISYGIVQCGPHIEGGVPYVRVSDMDRAELDLDGMLRTAPEIAARFPRSTLAAGDIVYSLRGKIGEVRVAGRALAGANLTQGTARLSPNQSVTSVYLLYAMRHPQSVMQAELQSKGTTFREITLADLRRIWIAIPTPAEQLAIGAALSDGDALLDTLERMIVKKQAMKQGVLQQLLAGTRRLPGFAGVWRKSPLGVALRITKGQLITEATVRPGTIPVIAGGKQPAYFHDTPNRTGRTVTVSGSGANAGFVSIHNGPIFASDCSTIVEGHGYSLDFIFYHLQWLQEAIYNAQTGGAQPHIHPADLSPLIVNLPPHPEQMAIARVMLDLDAEIAALQERRDKFKAIHQGMMQALLTGRVRLTNTEAKA